MTLKPSGYALYDAEVYEAWDKGTIFTMPFFGDSAAKFRVHGLDYAYDVAELVCVEGDYEGEKQSVSFGVLKRLLNGEGIKAAQYRYVNRWFDENGVPHFFGVYSKYPTIEETQRNVQFSAIDTPVDIVYQAVDEDDMFAYLHDVNRNQDNEDSDGEQDDNNLSPFGTL